MLSAHQAHLEAAAFPKAAVCSALPTPTPPAHLLTGSCSLSLSLHSPLPPWSLRPWPSLELTEQGKDAALQLCPCLAV